MEEIKNKILNEIIADIEQRIATADQNRRNAIEESKAHKGAMASRYDTFKEEAQYLAGAHNARIEEMSYMLNMLKSLKIAKPTITIATNFSLIEVEDIDNGSQERYLLLPFGGGKSYEFDHGKIITLSIGAPLARAFIGKVVGDEVKVKIGISKKQFIIISII